MVYVPTRKELKTLWFVELYYDGVHWATSEENESRVTYHEPDGSFFVQDNSSSESVRVRPKSFAELETLVSVCSAVRMNSE